jgi:hypothetical protein
LRRVAGTPAAATGAATKELMYRLGHVSPQAARHASPLPADRPADDENRPAVTEDGRS